MINKILFTIFVVIAIWKGFSMLSRLAKRREEGAVQNRGNRARGGDPSSPNGEKAVEMIACPRCGAYIDPRERCSCLRSRA